MVYGIAYCPVEFEEDLKRLGFADSKTLTEEKREELVGVIEQHSESLGWMVELISPTVICNHMLNMSKYSLNAISHDSAIGLIKQALDDGVCVTEVARDRAIQTWRFPEGLNLNPEEYGSGYPNDPATKKFLSAHMDNVFGFPSLVRFSWSTAEKVLEDNAATVSCSENVEQKLRLQNPGILGSIPARFDLDEQRISVIHGKDPGLAVILHWSLNWTEELVKEHVNAP
ncbi:hypothetical protein HPB47_008987 [Ixodes persulcatus]|uniref:Uncharacterized protein n=1 Tax=Ixodes persulcatus TaxID=34615 RepID=A0AC60P354_IXOPE|nr:hypothetical protein HPB47_008987 [Ixodes persulcatus]